MDILNLGPAAQRLADLIASPDDTDLARPTPCPVYTVGDLIDHIGGLALGFSAAAEKDRARYAGATGPSGDASRLGEDWRTRIPRDLAALAQAWAEPDAWTGMTSIIGMDIPAEMAGLGVADELVVHGWDLARATGQPYAPDEAARMHLRPVVSGQDLAVEHQADSKLELRRAKLLSFLSFLLERGLGM